MTIDNVEGVTTSNGEASASDNEIVGKVISAEDEVTTSAAGEVTSEVDDNNNNNNNDNNDRSRRQPSSETTAGVEISDNNNNSSNRPRVRRRKQYAVSSRWEREMEEKKEEEGSRSNLKVTGTTEDLNACFCCCANRIGGMFSLVEEDDGTPIVIAGPCWAFCAFITLPLILVSSFCVLFLVILNGKNTPIPWWLSIIYVPLLLVVLVSLFLVSCRDPGLLERVTDEEAGESGWFWNEQVASFRPAGAMYCRECKVLIQDYDHLCPWTGTGIGRNNILAFRVFVVAVNLLCYCSIGIVSYFLLKGILYADGIE